MRVASVAVMVLLVGCGGSADPAPPPVDAAASWDVAPDSLSPVDQGPPADAHMPPEAPAEAGLETGFESGGPDGPAGCPAGKVAFTAHVTDQASLFSVSPLPALAGGAGFEGRSYMTLKAAYTGVMVPIYAPRA